VDIGKLLQRTPKLLMKPLEQVQADAQQVMVMQAVCSTSGFTLLFMSAAACLFDEATGAGAGRRAAGDMVLVMLCRECAALGNYVANHVSSSMSAWLSVRK
jgi:hypothetical protein